MFLAGSPFEAPVSWVWTCGGGFLLPWIVILLSRGFTVSCPTTWSLALSPGMGEETGNVAPSLLIGFCLIWKRGSASPSHPILSSCGVHLHSALVRSPFLHTHVNKTRGTLKATAFMGCLTSLGSRPHNAWLATLFP